MPITELNIDMTSEDTLKIQLKDLALKIQDDINMNRHLIQSSITTFICNKILKHEHTSEGVEIHQLAHEYSNEVSLNLPENISNSIRDTIEFKSVLKIIDSDVTLLNEDSLHQFTDKIYHDLLNKPGVTEENIDLLVNVFLNDIHKKPCQSSALVEIVGLALASDEIELNLGKFQIVLRQARIADFERKYLPSPYYNPSPIKLPGIFSAIMQIKCCDTKHILIQDEIDKIITILRLFRPASVDYSSYSIDSEAILFERRGFSARIGKNEGIIILKKCHITRENLIELVDYCKKIYKIIPQYIYDTSKDVNINELFCSSLQVAYRHYSYALLRGIGTEEKIMNAVIGLESLLLHEKQDNTLRFWLRGAKILGFLNKSPKIVKHVLKSAYDVRSKFVHGSAAELETAMKKFNGENQDAISSLVVLLDYLRILIIATMFLSKNENFILTSKKGKKEFNKIKFLGIVDDSLIDKESENQLGELLQKCRV
jgi:Apea-like HEPN